MFQTKINATALRQFQADFHGELICPGDKGYDNARKVWNGMIEKYPALIARCTDVSDVTKAIQFARRHSLPVAVRGGGHSFAGYGTCDDELFKLIIEAGSALPSPWTQVILQHVHGAASRVGPTETAFALRGEYYDLQLMTSWNEEMASRAD